MENFLAMADFEGKLCEEIHKYPHVYDSLLEDHRSGTQCKESGQILNYWTGARKMAIYTGIIDIKCESLTRHNPRKRFAKYS